MDVHETETLNGVFCYLKCEGLVTERKSAFNDFTKKVRFRVTSCDFHVTSM